MAYILEYLTAQFYLKTVLLMENLWKSTWVSTKHGQNAMKEKSQPKKRGLIRTWIPENPYNDLLLDHIDESVIFSNFAMKK